MNSFGLRDKLKEAMVSAWSTERGRKLAYDVVYLRLPLSELIRDPPLLLFTYAMAGKIRPDGLTPSEDELLWRLNRAVYARFFQTGDLNETHIITIGSVWLGVGLWETLAKQLTDMPEVRGPLAYFFGVRFAQKNKTAQARTCFESALGDAGNDALLATLAQQQLEALSQSNDK